jgi:hypothetical protein
LYVLTTEPKILVVNATTNALIREMDLAGVSSGVEVLSDIAFTSDGYLLACNKDSISLPELKGRYFKVYTWDNDSVAPKLLFQTQYQASWSTGVVGETFAVSGPRWKCTFYTPAVTVGTSKQIRIMGLQYEEGVSAIGYKYMMDVTNYTEGLWGKKYKFSTSTTGSDHFYIDSDKLLPTEYQFNWGLADRSALVKKAAFAEKSGYVLLPVASGIQFFRHAKHVFMVSPVCGADSTAVGVAMFDVTDGLNNAKKLTVKYPEMGLGVDFTARDLQRKLKDAGKPWEVAKAFDNSAVIGNFIPAEEIEDVQNIHFRLDLNGKTVQNGHTADMIFPVNELIAHVSRFFTIKIGDILFTGTPAGVGAVKIGDRLEGYIENKKMFDFLVK